MPIYEYACAKCESEFEVEQRITEDPLKSCPKCRSRRVKRLISRTSFALKGGGWYADGYGSAAEGGKKGGEAAATGASDASSTTEPAKSEKAEKPEKTEKPGKAGAKGKKAVA